VNLSVQWSESESEYESESGLSLSPRKVRGIFRPFSILDHDANMRSDHVRGGSGPRMFSAWKCGTLHSLLSFSWYS
jgi:hypothetical protein